MEARLPAHLEVSGLLRAVSAAGGFATVLARGEREAGSILVVCCDKGGSGAVYERMPDATGDRVWTLNRKENPEHPSELQEYLDRRRKQDPDLWIVELDTPDAARFIGINHL